MDLPRRHVREIEVEHRKALLRTAVTEVLSEGDLTMWESVRIVSDVLGDVLGNLAKYGIREERHPDDLERPGGWE